MKNPRKSLSADLDTLIPILINAWRRFTKLSGPPDKLQTREFRSVAASIKILQEGSLDGKSLIGQDYFNKPELLGAYLLYHWAVHYQEGLSLIGELPAAPKRVLDICSGPGAYALAALRHGANEVIATDWNATALQLGAEVCGRYGYPLTVRPWNCMKGRCPVEGHFDLIIVAHALSELFPNTKAHWEEEQQLFIKSLLARLSPDGYLLLVENSFLEGNRRILQLRDLSVKEGVPVQAPCVWKGECPALKTPNSPCYAQRAFEKPFLIKELQRAASINLSSLKMSYLILRHPSAGWPQLPDRPLYRIISPPVDSFQGKRFYLCGTDGKKQLSSHLEEHPAESRAFEFLKRGELISLTNALEKQNALDIIEGTSVQVEAPLGKPLPQ